MLRHLIQQRDDDEGFTLVELLVVIVLLGVVGTIVVTATISSLGAASSAEDRIRALNDLQLGVQAVGRELRAANPLVLDANGDYETSVSASVLRDGDRFVFDYYLDEHDDGSTALFQDVNRYSLAGDHLSTREGVFITDIANDETGTPVFEYYAIDPETRELELIDCETLSESECRTEHLTAQQVGLTLEKQLPGQDPIAVESVFNIRNTHFDPTGG